MATNINSAFTQFRQAVDLEPSVTNNARGSRNTLVDEIKGLAQSNSFPTITGDFYHYGSFHRKTKIQPLDDLDMMVVLHAGGTTELPIYGTHSFQIRLDRSDCPLYRYRDTGTGQYVSSIRVLNSMRDNLMDHRYYNRSEVNRRYQAVVLNLTSYDWSFDIVPALGVTDLVTPLLHFLIPDGSGNWMRTDPRVDTTRTTQINQGHNEHLLPVIRMLKHWNRKLGKPELHSFHWETVILDVFEYAGVITSQRDALLYFFDYAQPYISATRRSPNGHGGPIDSYLSATDKFSVNQAIQKAAEYADLALFYENRGNVEGAINAWKVVFGEPFPAYG